MPTAAELLRQGKKHEIWIKYCGFLDLSIGEFMEIQERLLMEQLALIQSSEIGQIFIGDNLPTNLEEFRKTVPITTYEDYEPYFELKREDILPQPAFAWARTSGRSGALKWIPYTKQAYERLGERILSGVILAAARWKGDINIKEGDKLVYNTPPRPYISGLALRALSKHFNFRFIPPLDESEDMQFQERIEKGFETGLRTGIDILGSLAVVLVKMGEQFTEGARATKLSMHLLHPNVLVRLIRAYIRSKLEKRNMLPKDIWKLKAIPSGGMDTSIYKDKIEHYWGLTPFEQYGSTEEGAIATQVWNKKGMTFFPDAVLLEFIPEVEWIKWRLDPSYIPQTILFDQVKPGIRYEVVVTNFYGKPLVRYRMHDIIKIVALEDEETGIKLPQMIFEGRSSDIIDLAGFTGLIDEKLIWKSILKTEIAYEEWAIRKEISDGNPILHLYIELSQKLDAAFVQKHVHESIKALNPSYADYETMIGKPALKVTTLAPGSFRAYMMDMNAAGADLAHIKPPHMNASDTVIDLLLKHNKVLS